MKNPQLTLNWETHMASKLPHRFLPLTIQIGVLASSPGSCFAYGQKQDSRWKGLTQLTQVELTQELTKLLLYGQFCLKVLPLHAACKTIPCYIDVATWSRNLPQAEEEKKKDLWGWEETAAHSTNYLPVKAHWFLTSISQTPSVLYRMWPSKESKHPEWSMSDQCPDVLPQAHTYCTSASLKWALFLQRCLTFVKQEMKFLSLMHRNVQFTDITPTTEAVSSHSCRGHLSSTAVTTNELRLRRFFLFHSLNHGKAPTASCFTSVTSVFHKSFGNSVHEFSICPPKTLKHIRWEPSEMDYEVPRGKEKCHSGQRYQMR